MSEIQIFENPEFGSIRSVEIGGEPWLVGKDVAKALGYNNPQKALRDHVDTWDKTVNAAFTVNGTQGILVNESGVYSLIFSSKLPDAKKFKRWVTSEVLPSIRKTGTYTLSTKQRQLTTDDYMKAAAIVADCRNERLPYVLGFLEQGGFNISRVEPPRDSIPCIQKTSVEFRIMTLEDFF